MFTVLQAVGNPRATLNCYDITSWCHAIDCPAVPYYEPISTYTGEIRTSAAGIDHKLAAHFSENATTKPTHVANEGTATDSTGIYVYNGL